MPVLVDTNVLIDIVQNDRRWAAWSGEKLAACLINDAVNVNPVVYAELSAAYASIDLVEHLLAELGLGFTQTPQVALFLAGRAFREYRRRKGVKTGVLADFFIGAHAAVMGWPLLTRDARRYRAYFPMVDLIAP
ncbi:MAG: PIN domain-containing protein [Rhodospirillaceae bacterium]|nr:PIN domain-containing protein [Rhodospirillaceae bacterium]